MIVLHVFHDSEGDTGRVMDQIWQFQRDVNFEQPLISFTYVRYKASLQLLNVVKKKRHSYCEF